MITFSQLNAYFGLKGNSVPIQKAINKCFLTSCLATKKPDPNLFTDYT